jgi:hypothetical protein
MFSCSATKKWIKTNNLRSLREKKDIKNNKKYIFMKSCSKNTS